MFFLFEYWVESKFSMRRNAVAIVDAREGRQTSMRVFMSLVG
jgi:hypothetical protein